MSHYELDFYGWTQEQAALLKTGRLGELDVINLIEEIESMGRSERRELQSRLTILLVHLLKWKFQPARRGRSWQLSIEEQRESCLDVLEENQSLISKLQDSLNRAYAHARITASRETGIEKKDFPQHCPWTYEQMIDGNYYPD